MMLKNEGTKSTDSLSKAQDPKSPLKKLKGVTELKGFEFDGSVGFVCDVNTGICGPITKKEEGKE